MWRPGYSFDRRSVFAELPQRSFGEFVPDHEFVVIAPRSQLPVLSVPTQATDFLFVAYQFSKVLIWLSDVPVKNKAVPRARSQDMIIPCQCTNASRVPCHGAQAALLFCIPDLYETLVRTN